MAGNIGYIANIDITVNKKKFKKGDKICEKMAVIDIQFLLKNGYIKEIKETKQDEAKTANKKQFSKEE